MSSGLPVKADLAQCSRHVSKVPRSDTAKSARDAALAVPIREVQCWIYARRERRLGLVMRSLLAVTFAALTSIAAASAQPTTIPNSEPAASAFGPDPIIQITTTFRVRIEGVADPRDVPGTPAQGTARRTLYNMAANECTVLSEFWKAECRLNSFSVYVPVARIVGPDELPQVPSMFGTAVYELRLTSPGH
jgi:hypothetical protein